MVITIIKKYRNLKNKKQVTKDTLKWKMFHERFCSNDHNYIQDWEITFIEQVVDQNLLLKRLLTKNNICLGYLI